MRRASEPIGVRWAPTAATDTSRSPRRAGVSRRRWGADGREREREGGGQESKRARASVGCCPVTYAAYMVGPWPSELLVAGWPTPLLAAAAALSAVIPTASCGWYAAR